MQIKGLHKNRNAPQELDQRLREFFAYYLNQKRRFKNAKDP